MNGSGLGPYQSEDDFEEGKPSGAALGQYFTTNTLPTSTTGSSTVMASSAGPSNAGGSGSQTQKQGPAPSSFGGAVQGSSTPGRAGGNICCLLEDGLRCQRTAGNASYSKRVQKTVFYKRLRLDIDNTAQHTYICDHHKTVIQTARVRVKKESDEEAPPNENEDVEVDLYQLQVNTLRRYKKHFKIPTRPGLNKAQLAEILTKNFKTIPVNEKEIVTYFIYSIKSGKNKLDNRQPEGSAPNEYVDRY